MTYKNLRRIAITIATLAVLMHFVNYASRQWPEAMGVCSSNPSYPKCLQQELANEE